MSEYWFPTNVASSPWGFFPIFFQPCWMHYSLQICGGTIKHSSKLAYIPIYGSVASLSNLFFCCCFCRESWMEFMYPILKKYPAEDTMLFCCFFCLTGTLVCPVLFFHMFHSSFLQLTTNADLDDQHYYLYYLHFYYILIYFLFISADLGLCVSI